MTSPVEITPEKRRENQRQNQDYFSGKISELSRYIGFGLVALSFSLMSTTGDFNTAIKANGSNGLLWTGLIGCLVVAADYLQILFGWFSSAIAANSEKIQYKRNWLSKIFSFCQHLSFYLKQGFAIIGTSLFIYLISSIVGVPYI